MIKITVGVEGMACSMCEAHINEAVKNAFQIKKVTSSYTKKQTVILAEHDIEERLKFHASEGTDWICRRCHGGGFYLKSSAPCHGTAAGLRKVGVRVCGGWVLARHPVPASFRPDSAKFTVMMALDVALG